MVLAVAVLVVALSLCSAELSLVVHCRIQAADRCIYLTSTTPSELTQLLPLGFALRPRTEQANRHMHGPDIATASTILPASWLGVRSLTTEQSVHDSNNCTLSKHDIPTMAADA